jgi:hypothetical protein
MILKAIDLSLMAENLNIHKAVIEKLKLFSVQLRIPNCARSYMNK